jgi:hypothetical protein
MIKSLAERDPKMVRLAQQVAAKLEGYSTSTSAVLDDFPLADGVDPEINDSFCHELDRLVFCCTKCDYWFAQTENAHPGYNHTNAWMCKECKAEEAA